jgi:beta-aspartyl-peptidase (threonine type)
MRLAAIGLLGAALVAHADPGLERYLIGERALPTPAPTAPGLLLMGGGEHDPDGLRWFFARAGHGHIVVLRASENIDVAEEFYRTIGGVASVETFVVHGRDDAADPHLLERLATADGIYFAGGDQANYVRDFKGTQVARLIDAHVARGRPLAGTSAGLAILGEYLYGAMDGGSITSPEALTDPLAPAVTVETDFLHLKALDGYVTDSHFGVRNRLGRLIAFVAQSSARAGRTIEGLGIDEDAALAVDGEDNAIVYAPDPRLGVVWVHDVAPARTPGPYEGHHITATTLARGSRFNLSTHTATAPLRETHWRVERGQLVAEPDAATRTSAQ